MFPSTSGYNNGAGSSSREIHLRDQDLVRWLENKLGSSELWGGRHASSMLTREMLVELETCFQELEPATKMKIIQAMAHLSPKTLQAWKEPLLNLIELARRDPDDWVEAMADLFRNFPDLGFIQSSSRADSYFNKALDELMQILTKAFDKQAKDVRFPLPPDSELMNAAAIEATYGPEGLSLNRQKHFTLKKQGNKFDKLLAEVKKASEQQNNPANRKSHGMLTSSFPIKIRSCAKKLNNDLPMRGLSSSTNALKMSAGFTNDSKKFQQRTLVKRVGGAQLLDIAELPQPNKRRRTTSTVNATGQSSSTVAPGTVEGDHPKLQQQQQQRKNSLSNTKLAGAVAAAPIPTQVSRKFGRQQQKKHTETKNEEEEEENKAAVMMLTDTNYDGSSFSSALPGPSSTTSSVSLVDNSNHEKRGDGIGIYSGDDGSLILPHPSSAQLCLVNNNIGEQQFNSATTASTCSTASAVHQQSELQQQMAPIRPMVRSHPGYSTAISSSTTPMMHSSSAASSTSSTCFNNLFTEISDQEQQPQSNLNCHQTRATMDTNAITTNINIIENEALKQFNGLLKDANKLSPLSYNMIISFLSGNKTNPLMDKLGTLITLPLSETIEFENGYDGLTSSTTACVFLVETFFQMNYCTGEWKRLRKSRLLKPEEHGKYAHYLQGGAKLLPMPTPSSTAQSAFVVPSLVGHAGGGEPQQQPQQYHQHYQQQQQQQQHQNFWSMQQQQQQQYAYGGNGGGNASTSS